MSGDRQTQGDPPYGGTMSDLGEIRFTNIRRIKPPSMWRRFTWWLGGDHTQLCWVVMILSAIFMALHVASAARAGNW